MPEHLLFGHVDGAVNYSVGKWVEDAKEVLAEPGQGRLPIFTGGTGMYFKALVQGLSEIPPVPDEVRARGFAPRPRDWRRQRRSTLG